MYTVWFWKGIMVVTFHGLWINRSQDVQLPCCHKQPFTFYTTSSLVHVWQVKDYTIYPHLYNPCVAYPCGLRMEREAALITVKWKSRTEGIRLSCISHSSIVPFSSQDWYHLSKTPCSQFLVVWELTIDVQTSFWCTHEEISILWNVVWGINILMIIHNYCLSLRRRTCIKWC